MHDKIIAERFSRSARFGRRFLDAWRGRYVVVHGRRYIWESDFLAWIADHEVAPTQQSAVIDLKSTLNMISDRVLAERKGKTA